mgnify:CR=1 FL=1
MLKKFFSKALLSVVMDKNARKKLDAIRGEGQGTPPLTPEASGEGKKKEMTPERQALIRNAMKVRQEQTKILDELNDEQKLKLYAAAMKAFNIELDKKP